MEKETTIKQKDIYHVKKLDYVQKTLRITGARLLTSDEAQQYNYYLCISHYKGGWWTSSPDMMCKSLAIYKELTGGISTGFVGAKFYIRPALDIDISGSSFKVGDRFQTEDGSSFMIIDKKLAICEGDIGRDSFSLSNVAINDYNSSMIKRRVDSWANMWIFRKDSKDGKE